MRSGITSGPDSGPDDLVLSCAKFDDEKMLHEHLPFTEILCKVKKKHYAKKCIQCLYVAMKRKPCAAYDTVWRQQFYGKYVHGDYRLCTMLRVYSKYWIEHTPSRCCSTLFNMHFKMRIVAQNYYVQLFND